MGKKKLNIWILKDGETLPIEKKSKKMRTWRLGEALADRGHSVTWWTSNFFHTKKEKISEGDTTIHIRDNFKVNLIDCGAYKKNISFARIKHHFLLGKRFFKLIQKETKPDIMVVSFPPIELLSKAIKYGRMNNIPVIVDVRDMWPEVFFIHFPKILRLFLFLPFQIYARGLKSSLKKSQSIVAISTDCLNWALNKINIKRDERHDVFYLGYEESASQEREVIKELDNIPKGKVTFTFLGSFSKIGNPEFIVDHVKDLENDENFNGYFIIAGDGENRRALEEKVSSCKNVLLLGWLNRGQSSYLMENTDISISPVVNKEKNNLYLPNKIFEPLFFGKGIIHGLNGEAKDLLEKYNAGIYYESGNGDSFIQALKSALDEEKRKTMSKNAKRLYNDLFSFEKTYSKYCDHIEKIFNKHFEK